MGHLKVFSFLRVYALSGRRLWISGLVLLLGLVGPAVNIVNFPRYLYIGIMLTSLCSGIRF